MTELHEHDMMVCRACGNQERASEGYPCVKCGTFICVICSFRGVVRCQSCETPPQSGEAEQVTPEIPLIDWPEH